MEPHRKINTHARTHVPTHARMRTRHFIVSPSFFEAHFVCMDVLHICVYSTCVRAHCMCVQCQKKPEGGAGSLGLKLHVVSCPVGARN